MDDTKKSPKPRVGEKFDGESAVSEMLEKMDPESRSRLLRNLGERDPALVQRLKQRAFTFDHLLRLDAKGIQFLIAAVPRPRWVMALRHLSDALAAHIYGSLPARTRELFEEEMRELGPQRMSDVLAAQQHIAEVARKLIDEGHLSLKPVDEGQEP